jgi:hypothetical protein
MIQGFSGGLLNRELIYQTDLPSFQRDFASLKTLDHGTGPSITFTRASDATYFDADGVLQTASNNVARFDHDPATGGSSLGLLIEEARTNLLQRSEEFDNAYWSKSEVTITANDASAPSATSTADRVYPSGNSSAAQFSRNLAASASTSHSASVFVKAAGKTFGYLQINLTESNIPTRAFFFTINLSDGAVGTQQNLVSSTSGVTASAVGIGSGWYRLVVTFTTIATTDGITFHVGPCDAANSRSVTASGTDGILAWGAQLEAGAFATSYIPTTSAAATRAADSAVVTPISSFYNQAEGALFAEGSWFNQASNRLADNQVFVRVDDNTSNNMLVVYNPDGAAGAAIVTAASVVAKIAVGSTVAANTAAKILIAAKQNDVMVAVGGSLGTADTSATLPTVTHLAMRGAQVSAAHIRRIAYYPRRLSNSLLQQLTT